MENQEILIPKIKNRKRYPKQKIKKEGGKTKVAKFIYIAINVNTKNVDIIIVKLIIRKNKNLLKGIAKWNKF